MGEIWGCGWPPGVICTVEQTQDLGGKSELLGPHEDFLETVIEGLKSEFPLLSGFLCA